MKVLGVISGITAFILFIVVIFRAIKLVKNKEKVTDKQTLKLAGIGIICFFVSIAVTPSSENSEKKVEETSGAITYDVTSKDEVEQLVIDLLGDSSNTGDKRVESVNIHEFEDETLIGLTLNSNENLTANMAKKGMLQDTAKIMEELRKHGYSGDFSVIWKLPLTDTHGNTSPGKVLSIDVAKDDFDRINYDNFDYNKLPNLSSNYFEHPSFNK